MNHRTTTSAGRAATSASRAATSASRAATPASRAATSVGRTASRVVSPASRAATSRLFRLTRLALIVPIALLAGGCLQPIDEDESYGFDEAPLAAPGEQACPEIVEEGNSEGEGNNGGCGTFTGKQPAGATQSVAKKGSPPAGGGKRCPLPSGTTLVRNNQNMAEQLQCYVNTQNLCYTASAYANAALDNLGGSSGASNVASACSGMTGSALAGCLIDSAKAELAGTGAVCRDYAYLVDQACAQMGLSCEFQAGPKHAWVVLEQTPGCDYVIDAYNNISYCRP